MPPRLPRAALPRPLLQHSALGDIIGAYPLRAGLSDEEVARERLLRQCFTDFLLGKCTLDVPRDLHLLPFVRTS